MTSLAGATALAQAPPTISPNPTQRDWSGQQPVQYPDPDIIALDNRFRKYIVGNTTIKRLYTGTLWSEGPAWNGVGRYLVWSDIPNNVQMRWLEEDGRVTTFRNPSGYSNGNTFDFEGRQLSCEHGGRRVVRYEPTAPSPSSPTSSKASASTRPTTSSSIPMAASGSPIPPTASTETTKASRRRRN